MTATPQITEYEAAVNQLVALIHEHPELAPKLGRVIAAELARYPTLICTDECLTTSCTECGRQLCAQHSSYNLIGDDAVCEGHKP